MHPMMRMAMAGRNGGLSGIGADYTVKNLPPGWTKDWSGNVYDQAGDLVYGPDVFAQQRPLSVDRIAAQNSAAQVITLPTGQQITVAQYQALLAQQGAAQQQNLLSGGVTSSGVKIGSTNISWPMIAVAGLAFVLLQSSGYQKRAK
jgi:hypothetical protein